MLNMTKIQFKEAVNETIDRNPTILGLKSDVTELKSDVAELKSDVTELKSNFAAFKIEQHSQGAELHRQGAELHRQGNELHRLGLLFEDMQSDIRTIAQAVSPFIAKVEKIDALETNQGTQRDQIEVTQTVLREHISNPRAHRAAK